MSTTEVATLTGVTYRRLDYWSRCGYVQPEQPPNGSGYPAGWSQANVKRVIEIRDAIEQARAILKKAGLGTEISPHTRGDE